MKKIVRNILSGYFLVLLVLLLEVLALIALQIFGDDLLALMGFNASSLAQAIIYISVRAVEFIVAFIIFFRIINKAEDPEFKIPWLVAMLLLPLFTSVMYLIFGNHGLRRQDKRIVEQSKAHFQEYKDIIYHRIPKENLAGAIGSVNYIQNITGLSAHANNRVKYYATGEEFFPDMMKALSEAEEFIFMEFFIITDGKEWDQARSILIEKAKKGVEVRLVYDDMGCGGTIDADTPKQLAQYGIKCHKFHPFRPILSGMYNNRDHRKIVVVDHKYGFTGGCNLADEYANEIKRFGYWKDTMIRIEGSGINNLISVFLQNFDLAQGEPTDAFKYLMYEYEQFDEEGYVMPFGDGPGGIDDALIGEQNYINILNYAKKSVFISTPYLIPTYSLLDAMRNAALRGVEVNLILPGIPDKKAVYAIAKSHFRFLLDAGVNIYLYTPGFNHMKTALADGKLAFVGTINFDFRSLVHHFECGTLLYKVNCMKEIREDFDQMISVSEQVPTNYKLKRGTQWFCSIVKLITPLL